MLKVLLAHLTPTEIFVDAGVAICLFVGFCFPRLGDRFFGVMEHWGGQVARRKWLAVLFLALLVLLGRLALLPWLPVPVPLVQDEFSYLLAGDTFAHGRLSNPPNSVKIFLDTPDVNQQPAYVSKYPPAQGALLALGQVLGHPWIGVLLSAAALSAATLWALQGWLPLPWALLGGLIALLRLDLFSYWMNSYWGGAIPAIGGALVLGTFPRILRAPRAGLALTLGFGTALLANSRPFEGVVFCLPIFLGLVARLCSRTRPAWRQTMIGLVIPFTVVMSCCGLFMGYYNWRTTRDPLLFPYTLNERQYVTVPDFIWQKPAPPMHYPDPESEAMYNGWEREYWQLHHVSDATTAVEHMAFVILKFGYFFLWPELCIPLLALPWVLRQRQFQFLGGLAGICFLGSYSVLWFLPHYAAPVITAVFALLVQGIRRLRHWKVGARPVGIGLVRAVVLLVIVLTPFHHRDATVDPFDSAVGHRDELTTQLAGFRGNHLIIIHDPLAMHGIWINNGADIQGSPVVWAREIPGQTGHLLEYFSDRTPWLLDPGSNPLVLRPYPATAASENATAPRPGTF